MLDMCGSQRMLPNLPDALPVILDSCASASRPVMKILGIYSSIMFPTFLFSVVIVSMLWNIILALAWLRFWIIGWVVGVL